MDQVNYAIHRLKAQLQRLQEHSHFDYCEIDESALYGITSNILLFIHKIPGPRQVFGAKMAKQAEGNYNVSSRWRFVPTKSLVFPSRSICRTQIEPVIGLNRHPNGIPVVLAMVTQEGWSIEDALVFSRGFLERNGFLSTSTKEIEEDYKPTGDEQMRDGSIVSTEYSNEVPEEIRKVHPPGTYDKLDKRGIVKPGSVVKVGDCIIGAYQRIRTGREVKYRDQSTYIKRSKVGTVTKILLNETGNPTVKIEIQQVRIPEIGDKFSSLQAQKGVIGFVANDEDLAYGVPEPGEVDGLMAGLIPDCFMDPTAQPSRMTTGMLNDECLKSLAAIPFGKVPDATAFRIETTKAAEQELKSIGINFQSEHLMVSGKTGVPFKVRIYIGVVQYLRLVHEAVTKFRIGTRAHIYRELDNQLQE